MRAVYSGGASGNEGTQITYTWSRGGTMIPGASGSEYTVTEEDVGSTITVGADATGNYAGYIESSPTAAVSKAEQQAPNENEGFDFDYVRETIAVNAGFEVYTAKENGSRIEDGDSITGYIGGIIYIRRVETAAYKPSDWTEIIVPARPDAGQPRSRRKSAGAGNLLHDLGTQRRQ